jgi:HK97 family phage portal protein
MSVFNRPLSRIRAVAKGVSQAFSSIGGSGNGGWWPVVRESFTGAWQRHVEVRRDLVLAYWAVNSCMTLIAGDVGKLRAKLMEQQASGVWKEITSPAFSPVLRRPNKYQTWQKFAEQWIISKLAHGNTYVVLVRDRRQVVVEMHVLNPYRVTPLVAPDGSVYYQLQQDDLAQVSAEDSVAVPASEIIHDTMIALFHPLVGISPIYACGLAATQGLRIQENSTTFFANMSRPSGILTSPGQIDDIRAKTYKARWEENYGGANVGRVAVLGNDLKYQPLAVNADDAQLVDQLKLTAEVVCSTFHVPAYMVGAGPTPPYANIQAVNQQYFSQCLQTLIESMEAHLDYGLGLGAIDGRVLGIELDIGALLRMDSLTQMEVVTKGIQGGAFTPNDGRAMLDLEPLEGGGTVYLQQQQFSLAALAKRDARDDPFATKPTAMPTPSPAAKGAEEALTAALELFAIERKELAAETARVAKAELDAEAEFKDLADALIARFTIETANVGGTEATA